ncbi:MAG: hypothetical protein WBZ37_08750 [Mycobacterium sp.]
MYQECRPNPRLAALVECGWARSGSAARPLANYADQAHMINECLAMSGMSPTALPMGVSVSSNTTSGETF